MTNSKPRSRLIVVSAPSGTGKSTLCARLLKEIPELILSISTTTRSPRGQEREGVEYFFVSKEDFLKNIEHDRFAEWAEVHGHFYGTSKDFIERAFTQGKSLLLDIDVQGANALTKSYPVETIRIFVRPPSVEELERRLRARGTDSEESIVKRMRNATSELLEAKHFDYLITNDDLDRTYFELSGIVLHHLRGTSLA